MNFGIDFTVGTLLTTFGRKRNTRRTRLRPDLFGPELDKTHFRYLTIGEISNDSKFVQAYPNMASHQIKFLDLLQNHIAKFGSIKTDDLYEPPFTTLHSDSLDGLFDESLADELFEIIGSFQKGDA